MRRLFIVWLAVTALAAAGYAQRGTDLSGTWKLNLTESYFGMMHSASQLGQTLAIEQKGLNVKETRILEQAVTSGYLRNAESRESTRSLVADGKPQPLPPPDPNNRQSLTGLHAYWQGGCLIVLEQAGMSKTRRTYFLSEDGKQLTVLVESSSNSMESEQKLIFDKQ
jgi:hypothetical protein